MEFDQRFWLQNPFASVDVGVLVGSGEAASGLLLIHLGMQTKYNLFVGLFLLIKFNLNSFIVIILLLLLLLGR